MVTPMYTKLPALSENATQRNFLLCCHEHCNNNNNNMIMGGGDKNDDYLVSLTGSCLPLFSDIENSFKNCRKT